MKKDFKKWPKKVDEIEGVCDESEIKRVFTFWLRDICGKFCIRLFSCFSDHALATIYFSEQLYQ